LYSLFILIRVGFINVFHGDHGLLINPAHDGSILDRPMSSWDDLWAICGILILCITLSINMYRSDHVIGSAGVHDRPMYAMGRSLLGVHGFWLMAFDGRIFLVVVLVVKVFSCGC
jgi:hypothetical protein